MPHATQGSNGQLFAVNETSNGHAHAALSSVWEGTDGALLEAMLNFYPSIKPDPILDATCNVGRIWRGMTTKPKVVSMDIDPRYQPDIVADNRVMDGVRADRFGCVVYDPPHVGPQGRDKSVKRFDVDFGATVECGSSMAGP